MGSIQSGGDCIKVVYFGNLTRRYTLVHLPPPTARICDNVKMSSKKANEKHFFEISNYDFFMNKNYKSKTMNIIILIMTLPLVFSRYLFGVPKTYNAPIKAENGLM